MIVVMGATGHTGRIITETLLKAGETVRALGRSAERLAPLRELGAEVLAGDAGSATYLVKAFHGADRAYTLLPPDPQSIDFRAEQDRVGEAIVRAVKDSGVRHVVFLSSVGADQKQGTGPIAGLHAQEERLRHLDGTHVLSLRAAFFFENFQATLPLIKHQGINGGAIAPNLPVPMIASRDIAEVAAKALHTRSWNGRVVHELLGERDLTHTEATQILGARIGKPDLKYVQFPYGDYAGALVQAGLSQDMAGLYVEMAKAFNEGRAKSLEGRRPQNTTPTRFEDFADELASAYRAL
jgi:uncharacterized protein YbjT (DUF2867 family)